MRGGQGHSLITVDLSDLSIWVCGSDQSRHNIPKGCVSRNVEFLTTWENTGQPLKLRIIHTLVLGGAELRAVKLLSTGGGGASPLHTGMCVRRTPSTTPNVTLLKHRKPLATDKNSSIKAQ